MAKTASSALLLFFTLSLIGFHGADAYVATDTNSTTSLFWPFDDGNLAGWVPIIGWNSQAGRPEYPQSCQVINGEYSLTTCESLYRSRTFSDFVFETQVRVIQSQQQSYISGVGFRVNPALPAYASMVAATGDPYTLAQGYYFEFVGASLYLYKCQENCTVLASPSTPIAPLLNNTLKVVALGQNITGFLNDAKVFDVVDPVFSSGVIGLFSIPNGCDASGCSAVTSNFDNVKLTPLSRNQCTPAPSGLVSWWTGDGTTSDIQSHNDGVLANGATFTAGEVGQAFTLNGLNQYVQVGNPDNLKISSGITLDAWVNPAAPPPVDDSALTGIYAIVTKWGQSATTDSYGIWLHNPDGNIRLVGGVGVPGVGDGGVRNGGAIPVGQWSHVATTYDNTTGLNILYVNGVQVAQRVRPGGITVSGLNVQIGKEDSNIPRYFNGAIDEVEIYNRALTNSEIQSIFNAEGAGKCKAQATVHVSKFFTDSNQNPLATDLFGNPKVDAVLANGQVRSTNPGQVLAWVNMTNTGSQPFQSLRLNETLPLDWSVHPPWIPAQGGIHVFFVFANGTRLEITNPITITVTGGTPESIALSVPDFNSTAAGKPLALGDSVLLSVKISYALTGTIQPAKEYPRNYTDTASATAWTAPSYTGAQASGSTSASFVAYAKVVGDVDGDEKVDAVDIALVASSIIATPASPDWDLNADIDNNGVVNRVDLALVIFYSGSKPSEIPI